MAQCLRVLGVLQEAPGSRFYSQYPQGSSQPSLVPVPGVANDFFLNSQGTAYMKYIEVVMDNRTLTHKKL